jgi:ribonucleotide monophosphatase NagD (HAD superfamily)
MARYVFDLDGTLVTDVQGKYDQAKPILKAVAKVQRLHEAGHTIIIMTARGASSGVDRTELTKQQLTDFDIPHDELVMNMKPTADYFIDDKGVNAHDWLEDEEAALAKVTTIDHANRHIRMDQYFPLSSSVNIYDEEMAISTHFR